MAMKSSCQKSQIVFEQVAQLRYTISFDEEYFCIDGRARLDFIRPNLKKDAAAFEQLVDDDGGESFYAFLAKQKKSDLYRVRLDKAKNWFCHIWL